MALRTPTPPWQIISRTLGVSIVLAVLVGWFRGLPISDPGVLALLGIASWLLGINVAVNLKRNGGSSNGQKSSSSERDS